MEKDWVERFCFEQLFTNTTGKQNQTKKTQKHRQNGITPQVLQMIIAKRDQKLEIPEVSRGLGMCGSEVPTT